MTRRMTRLVREGEYAAEVDVQITDDEGGWAHCMSVEEALNLDDVREALRTGDLEHPVPFRAIRLRLTGEHGIVDT